MHGEKKNTHQPYTKINTKGITDLHVKCKTLKLLRKNTGENSWDLGGKQGVLRLETNSMIYKGDAGKLKVSKLKNFCSLEAHMKIIKRPTIDQKKHLQTKSLTIPNTQNPEVKNKTKNIVR